MRSIVIFISIVFFSSCLSKGEPYFIGVPEIEDPVEKLNYSIGLFEDDRLIPSERMIYDALKMCKKTKDRECLARGYLFHALFLANSALNKRQWISLFKNGRGFLDKTVTFDTRHEKAGEYIEKGLLLKPKDKKVYNKLLDLKSKGYPFSPL